MDLNTVDTIVTRPTREAQSDWQTGDAWLAGGTWIFSEPQPHLRRLIDLNGFGWAPLSMSEAGLSIAATCRIATLQAWADAPPDWTAAALIDPCCRALLGSFKVWNVATVGGNICLALPAGPMTALAVALDATCLIWGPGQTERRLDAIEVVTGNRTTALGTGEILRAIELPADALRHRFALRQISLSPLGRSGALLIGTVSRHGAFALTVTGSTVRPFRFRFDHLPTAADLRMALDGIPVASYHDDVHGRPDWRQHVTGLLARDIRDELTAAGRA